MANRDFLTLLDCSSEELDDIVTRARELKARRQDRSVHQSLSGRTLAMVFQQNSTRTRMGFEAGMSQLGGHAVFLSPGDTQLAYFVRGFAQNVFAQKRHTPGVRGKKTGYQVEKSSLPCAVGSDDSMHLVWREFEIDVVHGDESAKALR